MNLIRGFYREYIKNWFMLMYDKNHYNIVISLQLIKKILKKRTPTTKQ